MEQAAIIENNSDPALTDQIITMLIGCMLVYSLLFGFGWLLMGNTMAGIIAIIVAIGLGYILGKMAFKK